MLAVAGAAAEPPAPLARPVALADHLRNGDRLGRLQLRGLLELPPVTVDGQRLAGLSGLAWDDDEELLYALSDLGALFVLRPVVRDGMLVDAVALRAHPLLRPDGERRLRHWQADSEGLDIVHGRNGRRGDAELIVSFEGDPPRISRYRPDGRFVRDEPLPPALRDPRAYAGTNKSLEAVCRHPQAGILTVPERPLRTDPPGHTRLHALSGRSWSIPRLDGGVVAIECLANGELLLLERDFSPARLRTAITLHRLRLPTGAEPATLERLARLDTRDGLRLDNFEGLAHHRGQRFFLVSDDNDVFVQRTLLMYVELLAP